MEELVNNEYLTEAERKVKEFMEKLRKEGKLQVIQDYYHSGERPITEMNDEEYALIYQILDEFMESQNILYTLFREFVKDVSPNSSDTGSAEV